MKSTLVVLAFIILSVDASGYYDLHAGDSTYWCEGCEGPAMADTLLNFQRPSGGWPKNVDPTPGDVYWGKEYSATLDNDATVGEIRFMAQAYKETGVADYVESAEKGLDFIFDSQYPTGGWPQTYPGASSYKAHITFNDNLHVNVLRLLDEVAAQMSPFDILPFTEIATQAKSAVKMGLKCLVDTQIHVPDTAGGMCPTTRRNWCAQHDRNTLEPMPGRDYEPVSFSGREGINIAHYLMSLDNPSADIKEAIVGAYIWAKTAVLMNYSVELDKNNNRILAYHKGAQLWPRFATIPDSEAIFCDRGCVDNPSLEHNQYPEGFASINAERRNGYYWLGNWGANIVQRFEEEWSVDHQVTINPSCVGLTFSPTLSQTSSPTRNPTASPTSRPTLNPTASPTPRPSVHPTSSPTSSPSFQPTTVPTASPTLAPTLQPTDAPTRNPTLQPTGAPTASPTASPSLILTENAGASPAPNLAASSTSNPTASPTPSPTSQPNDSPTINPMQSLSLEEAPAALPFTEDEGKGAFSYQPSPRPFPVPTAVYTPNTPIAPSPSAPSLFSPSTPIASPAAPFSLTNREVKVATSTSGVNTTCGTDALPSDVESQVQQVIEWEFGVCLSESDIDTVAGKILVALNTDLVDTFLDCQFDDTWNVKGIYMPSEIPQCTTDSSTGGNCYLCNHEFVVAVLRRAESMGEQAVHTNLTDIISTIGGFLNEFDPELPEIDSLSFGGIANTDGSNTDASQGGGGANALQSGGGGDDNKNNLVFPMVIVGSAMFFLVAIAAIAMKRKHDDKDESIMSHVPLKDDDDYEDDLDTDRSSISTGGIMRDLAEEGMDEDAEVQTSAGETAPLNSYSQAQVVGEGDSSTMADEDSEVRFLAGQYPGNGVGISTTAPTFVATDLKKAMKDLEPPSSLKQSRGYIHDDTVDL